MRAVTATTSNSAFSSAHPASTGESRLKTWIVTVFLEVDTRPLWQVVVAKLIHRLWPRFPRT
jgi:hypothetical protein